MQIRNKAIGLAILLFVGLATAGNASALSCKRVKACAGGSCTVYLVCEDGSVWQEA